MTIRFHGAIPVLRIFDETQARRFYLDYLGCEIVFEHRFEANLPLYMRVQRAGLTLDLSGHHGDSTPGSTAFVQMEGIEAFHTELRSKDAAGNIRPGLEDAPWGGKMMEVQDPFGNRLRFSST